MYKNVWWIGKTSGSDKKEYILGMGILLNLPKELTMKHRKEGDEMKI